MLASQEGHVEVVDRLIQHRARVDLQEKVKQLYPTPAATAKPLILASIIFYKRHNIKVSVSMNGHVFLTHIKKSAIFIASLISLTFIALYSCLMAMR